MGLIKSAAEIETLASSVEDNGGAYFVPAFSGLFAPYWRADARGVIAGLTRYVTKRTSPVPSWRPPPGRPVRSPTP